MCSIILLVGCVIVGRDFLDIIKRFIQKIKCSIPFNFTYFGHEKLIVIYTFSKYVQLVGCQDCGALFAINHDVRQILPWECVSEFYEESPHEGSRCGLRKG